MTFELRCIAAVGWVAAVGGLGMAAAIGPGPIIPGLPKYQKKSAAADWLIDGSSYKAGLYRTANPNEFVLANGLVARTFRIAPNAATVGFDNLVNGQAVLRGVKPEAIVELDGVCYEVGGLKGQANYAYLLSEWVDGLQSDPAAMQFVGIAVGEPKERIKWKRVRHHAPGAVWPPRGVYLRMDYRMPDSAVLGGAGGVLPSGLGRKQLLVSVHYELYDGIPCMSKWITVLNGTEKPVRLQRFVSEVLAAVEYGSAVEERGMPFHPPNIHVETDHAMGGMTAANTSRRTVHWVPDPQYTSQVNYLRKNPCMLEVRPELGPDQVIEPGKTFESFRAFIMPFDSYDRERNGLALRRMYRTVAPWVTENPLMMHVRRADWKSVKLGIDQCAEVGFEMIILTFGSGFNIENESAKYLAEMKRYADYAREKGVEIGGYSLLASRRVGGGHDVVMPRGQRPTFGNSPCLESQWGKTYFRKLYRFYEKTGFALLEHDGSYPGDPCTATHHPGHEGYEDSRWNQRVTIGKFYAWCREKGIYLNVPDYYYMSGSGKCGMGYREVNWSLPRAQQVIHTRHNIFDGTWQKTPSMGWMFVPLTQYHGGGAAATIEPLDKHRDHYERMLYSNLALGVQACYRGPRLYDTDATKALVKKWVDWFKQYRDILESDLIHGRRADGRDLDWMLHVNPALEHKGMLVVFNPLQTEVTKTLKVPLYYTGLTETVKVSAMGAKPIEHELARDYTIDLPVTVSAEGMTWYVIE